MGVPKLILDSMRRGIHYSAKDIAKMVHTRECLAKTFLEGMLSTGLVVRRGVDRYEKIK